jgi:hypothetical protein
LKRVILVIWIHNPASPKKNEGVKMNAISSNHELFIGAKAPATAKFFKEGGIEYRVFCGNLTDDERRALEHFHLLEVKA